MHMGFEEATTGTMPFTGERVSLTDPSGTIMTIIGVGVGFAALFAAQDTGKKMWDEAAKVISNLTGAEVGDESGGIGFRGEL